MTFYLYKNFKPEFKKMVLTYCELFNKLFRKSFEVRKELYLNVK